MGRFPFRRRSGGGARRRNASSLTEERRPEPVRGLRGERFRGFREPGVREVLVNQPEQILVRVLHAGRRRDGVALHAAQGRHRDGVCRRQRRAPARGASGGERDELHGGPVELGASLRRGCRARLARRLARLPRLRGAHAGPGGALVLVRGHHLREPPRHLQRLQRLRHRRIARHGDERVAAERPRGVVARRRQAPGIAGQHGEQRAQAAGFAERGAAWPKRAVQRRLFLLRRVRGTRVERRPVRRPRRRTRGRAAHQAPAPVREFLGRRRGDAAPVALQLARRRRGRRGRRRLERRRRRDELPDNLQRIHRHLGVLRARRARGDLQQHVRRGERRGRTDAGRDGGVPRVRVQRRDPQRRESGRDALVEVPVAGGDAHERQDDVVPPLRDEGVHREPRRLLHRGRRLRVVRGRAQVAVRRGLPEVDGAVRVQV